MANTFFSYLKSRLTQPLPGQEAQMAMMPMPVDTSKGYQLDRFVKPEGARESAVLLLLTGEAQPEILFTLRSTTLGKHGGQISFPGGGVEGNENWTEAALREANEEVALPPDAVSILGELSPLYVPVSGSFIYPVVGYASAKPHLVGSEAEVAEIFFVPLNTFLNPAILGKQVRNLGSGDYTIPYWSVHPTTPLWGATAIILSELLALYRSFMGGARV